MILSNKAKFLVDYQEQKLSNVFVLNNSTIINDSYDGDTLFYGSPEWAELFEVNHCLMIATPILDNDEVITNLQSLATKGISVFILLGDPELSLNAIDSLAGHCCIRAGVQQNGSLVIADHGYPDSYALILSALVGNEAPSQYLCRLDEEQEDAYFDIFCRLFWHEAKYEYLSQSHSLNRPVNKESSPVQEISVAHKHIFPESLSKYLITSADQATHLYSQGDGEQLWGLLEQNAINIPKEADIWLNLDQVCSQKLARLVQKSENIFLSETPLIQMLATDTNAWILPQNNDEEHYNWVLKLTSEQLGDCIAFNEIISSAKSWRLQSQISVDEINSPLRYLAQVSNEVHWKNKVELDLGKVECANFHEYENSFKQGGAEAFADDRSLIGFDKANLSKKISFSIDIQPPRLPKKSTEDLLHKQWIDIQAKWNSEVDTLNIQLQKIESSKNNIAENVQHFMGSFLTGQLNSQRTLQKKLDQLRLVKLNQLSISHRNEQITIIKEIESNILMRGEKLTKEHDKATQQLQWNNKKEILNKKIQLAQEETRKTEQVFTDFEAECEKEIQEQNSLLFSGWKDFIDKASPLHKDGLADFSCDEIIKWVSEQSKNKVIPKNNNSKNKNNKGKDNKKEHDDLKGVRRIVGDYKQKLSFLNKENTKWKAAFTNAQGHLERTVRDADKLGTFKVKDRDTQSALAKLFCNNKPTKSSLQFELPKEDLPEVGLLFSKGQQRYLLIKEKHALEQAKLDCERLNAKLVVEKEE